MKRLYRSRDSSVIGGVCGGLAEYFVIDPVIVRIIFIVFTIAWGMGLVIYIVGWIMIPMRPQELALDKNPPAVRGEFAKYLPGLILIVVGAMFLMGKLWHWFSFMFLWPLLIVAVGAYLIYRSMIPKKEKDDARQ